MKSLFTQKTYLLVSVLFLLVSSSFAATFYVGTCHSPSYSTISAAVAAAPPNSTVDVCPGVYPEQVFIYQPLTLQGIKSGSADRARIVVPISVGGGINWTKVPDPDGGPTLVAPQIFVTSPTGPVKISNLTIDASGETAAPACNTSGFWFTTAILLENSSATLKGVNTVGQGKNSGCGVGIWDFVAGAAPAKLSLTNSSLQDAAYIGLYLEGAALSVSVTGNVLDLASNEYGILIGDASGTVSSNFLSAPAAGLVGDSGSGGSITYSSNVLQGTAGCAAVGGQGMLLQRAAQVTGNKIDGCAAGIVLSPLGTYAVSIKNNLIVNSSFVGVELACDSNVTLAGNTVNNAPVGVDSAPSAVSATQITFDNVDTLATGTCP